MKTVTLYTDGACSGNPGAGGYAAILKYRTAERVISGGEGDTLRASAALLDEFRGGKIGRISLETPEDIRRDYR